MENSWGSEKLRNLTKVTRLLSGGALWFNQTSNPAALDFKAQGLKYWVLNRSTGPVATDTCDATRSSSAPPQGGTLPGRRTHQAQRQPLIQVSSMWLTLTWPQSCSRHLCGHEPSQVLDLGFGARWLHWGVDGLEGGRHDLGQVDHADENLWDVQEGKPVLTHWPDKHWPHARPMPGMAVTKTDLGLLSWSSDSWGENESWCITVHETGK